MQDSVPLDIALDDYRRFVIDPSFLSLLFTYTVSPDGLRGLHLHIPDNLARLIDSAHDNHEHADLLLAFINLFIYRKLQRDQVSWDHFFWSYDKIRTSDAFVIFNGQQVDEELLALCISAFDDSSFHIELSPAVNLLGDVIGKILAFSKRSGVPVLMRTRRLARMVRSHLDLLELATLADTINERKQSLSHQIFNFAGGQSLKFFVGFMIAINLPVPFNVPALQLAFAVFDP